MFFGCVEFVHVLLDAVVYSRGDSLMHGHGTHNVCFLIMFVLSSVFLYCFVLFFLFYI